MLDCNNQRRGGDRLGFWLVFLVGMHSITLGLVIYFFTDFFYRLFFAAPVENIFFVRQSGVFLFLAGLFYLYPLVDLKKFYNVILLVIVSKLTAVYFLVANAKYTLSPPMIYLAASFDGLMAIGLIISYRNFIRGFSQIEERIPGEGQFVMSDK